MSEKHIFLLLKLILVGAVIITVFTISTIRYGLVSRTYEDKYIFTDISFPSEIPTGNNILIFTSEDGIPLHTASQTGYLDMVIKEAFRKIGVTVYIFTLPAERALQCVNDGINDGDFTRITGLEKKYPNLVLVPEELLYYEYMAFTKHVKDKVKGWSGLKPYDVGIITGWKILEANVRDTRSLVKVRDEKVLFTLLENERVDIVTYYYLGGNALIKELNFQDIHAIEPPLSVNPMYLYLNKKHKSLIPNLVASLKELKRDGTYDRLFGQ
ncbi:MAG: transporter substrate-binding domain-containing protein [Candidatus Eremiobacterota bacterium]